MIKISVNNVEKELSEASESWIADQINHHRGIGAVCVKIYIKAPGIDLALASEGCGSGQPGGRKPNRDEMMFIDAWQQFQLGSSPINTGRLIAFLKQIDRYV
ncbi:hypothetical protein MKP05_19410 [Halomonas sp. EGI 63088]|uniref:Uncharacterized protein n=1 Tax=Halomonas flagellata TaxID=2920385 RepID=A0ABS9RZI4_9GAMM|nr:hypothetical protein [Halomonas flagellata]MCH4565271.1 hypothetical protein [Halomonas flagellata]